MDEGSQSKKNRAGIFCRGDADAVSGGKAGVSHGVGIRILWR